MKQHLFCMAVKELMHWFIWSGKFFWISDYLAQSSKKLLGWSQLVCNLERRGEEGRKREEKMKKVKSHFLNVTSSTRSKSPKLDLESDQNLSFLKLWGKWWSKIPFQVKSLGHFKESCKVQIWNQKYTLNVGKLISTFWFMCISYFIIN